MLKNMYIADIPIIFAAIDPCVCCAERLVEVEDARDMKRPFSMRFSDLRKMAIEHYKKVDLSKKEAVWPF